MSWKKVTLGEFLKVRDNRFKPNDRAISHLKRIEKIDFSGEIFISDKPSNTDMILVKKGDLVISGINVEKGAMAVYTGDDDITATIHYSSYSFDNKKTDIEFLKFFLKSIEFRNALKEQVPGGIKTEIKPKHLLPLVVEIPTDIKDQRKVVEILKNRNAKADAISQELTYQLSLVKKIRQQLLQEAVQGKLIEQNPKDEPASELLKKIKAEKQKLIAEKKTKSEFKLHQKSKMNPPYELPDNWEWVRFWEIAWCFRGHNPAKIHFKKEPRDGYVRFIQITDFKTDDQAVYVPMSKQLKLVSKGEIVMAAYRHIGKFSREMEGAFNVALCKVNNIEPFSRDFLSILIKSDLITGELLAASKRGHIPSMHTEHLLSLWVPVPPLSEQNRIVQKLDELMQYCNELEASIKKSESQIEKLLQQVLREALRKEPVEV